MHEDREQLHEHSSTSTARRSRVKSLYNKLIPLPPGPTLNLGTTHHDVVEQNRKEEKRRDERCAVAPKIRPNFGCITGSLGVGVF